VFAWWRGRNPAPWQPGPWVYLLAIPLGINEALLRPHFPETHNLVSDWWNFNHYALLFIYGFVLCGVPGLWDWLLRLRRINLLLAGVCTASILAGEALGWSLFQDDTVGDAFTANVFTWLWQLVFLGYGRRWLSFSNAALRYLSEAGYPIYILHQTVIVVIAWFVIGQAWPWQVKYFTVLGTTIVLCFALYEGLIRRWRVSRLLFGLKPPE
jgi:peptidoglycan/LPS O-acetylase OafA/YrhL